MQIINIEDLNIIDFKLPPITATIGYFDGVHIGHQALLNELEQKEGATAIITFDYHPSKNALITLHEKITILKKYNIDYCIVVSMHACNQNIEYDKFIEILKQLNVKEIIVGNDVKFGKDAKGNVYELEKNFRVEVFPFINNKYGKISSSTIRNLIDEARFDEANKLLNRTYKITGIVQKGRQIGRTIGFPTANVYTENYIPKNGIYITTINIADKEYEAVTNIGYQPTVGGEEVVVEVHILDFDENIYGEMVSVEFKKLIRYEKKFDGLEQLKEQIKKDVEEAREFYGNKEISK